MISSISGGSVKATGSNYMKVVKHLFGWIGKGIKHLNTYYVTGNHDEMLRKLPWLKMALFVL